MISKHDSHQFQGFSHYSTIFAHYDDKHTNDQYLYNQTSHHFFWKTWTSSLPFETFGIPDTNKKIKFSNYEICQDDLCYKKFENQ